MTRLDRMQTLTTEQVNARLPLVRRIVQELQDTWQRCQDVRLRVQNFRGAAAAGGSGEVTETIRRLQQEEDRIEKQMVVLEKEVMDLGGILRDPKEGLVDFFSVRDGHLIFLTWRLGDEEVLFWHEVDSSLVDRHPLYDPPPS